jgi:hypothetical protein
MGPRQDGQLACPKQRASPLSARFTQTETSHATWRGVARRLHSAGSSSAARPCFRSVTSISGGASSALLGADSRCAKTLRTTGLVSNGSVFTAGRVDWQRADIRIAGIHQCSFGRRAFEEVRVSGPSLPSSRSGPAVKGGPTGPSEASREAAPLTAGERRLRRRSYWPRDARPDRPGAPSIGPCRACPSRWPSA